jgi:Fic family protein
MTSTVYHPNFKYTHKVVKNLTHIAEARTIILNSPLIPKWEVSLRREALIHSAHSSTAIEGNPLTLEEVTDLAAGRDIMVRRKDRQEVLNYLEALERIPEFAQIAPFRSLTLLEIHKIVTKATLDNPEDVGVFRNRQVVVGNRITGQVTFRPPSFEDVPDLVEQFLKWFNSEESNDLDPVITAGITHYELVRIHPFVDGNGRTARVMASIVFYGRRFDVKRFFALDDYYDNDRRAYYDALKSVNKQTLDLTSWLEYFTEGVAVSIEAVKKKVIGLSKDIKALKQKGQIALTARQMRIVEKIVEHGSTTNREVREISGLSDESVRRELSKLIILGVIRREGEGRAVHYVLA